MPLVFFHLTNRARRKTAECIALGDSSRGKDRNLMEPNINTHSTKGPTSPNHLVALVSAECLVPVSRRLPLTTYTATLWERRHFIETDARSRAFRSGQDTLLGKAWIVLDPLLQVLLYALVFGLLLRTNRGIDNFVGFLVIGVVFFGMISRGLTLGSGLLQKSRNIISTFDFPTASIVLSAVMKHTYDNIVPALIAVGTAVATHRAQQLTWAILGVLPIFALIHAFSLGATFLVARSTAFIPDLSKIVALFVRGLFFISGIFFTIDRFSEHSVLHTAVALNPVYQFLAAVRSCVLDGEWPSTTVWLYLTTWSLLTLIVGFIFFWRAEHRYAIIR